MSTTSTGSSSPRSPAHSAASELRVPETPVEIERALRSLGIRPRRSLGQSFLSDPFVADAEVALLAPQEGERVVEIGGGLGLLTQALLRRGVDRLTVIEKDHRLAGYLRRTFDGRVEVLEADALQVDWTGIAAVVGNLPFSIATPILLKLFAARRPRGVFLLQREVADRVAAGAGSRAYGRLSILAAVYGHAEPHQMVPSRSFVPEPRVAGRIVTFVPSSGALPVPSVPQFEELIRRLFSARRKQLKNLLPGAVGDGRDVAALAADAGWPAEWPTRRPEQLPPELYFSFARTLGRSRED